MRRNVARATAQVGLLFAGATVGVTVVAPAATAAPSNASSCVAQFVHDPDVGPPGQIQRGSLAPRFGQEVSFVARQKPADVCRLAPPPPPLP
jgi:hypothetical protein